MGLLDLIGQAEGTDKGRGYDETLGYGLLTGGPVNLTGMTLDQIDQLQTSMLNHPENKWNSSAAGRYQIVRKTLRGLRDQLGLKGDQVFTPQLQDTLATKLAERRGPDVQGLRNEWQGLNRVDPNTILAAAGGAPASPTQPQQQQVKPMATPTPDILSMLLSGQAPQQQQQGGLLGMLQNPETYATMQELVKAINPWSQVDPAATRKQALAQREMQMRLAEMQRSQANADRGFGLQREQFDFARTDKTADNTRADAQLRLQEEANKRANEAAGLTDVAKDLIQAGFKPNTDEYRKKYKEIMEIKLGKTTTDDQRELAQENQARAVRGEPPLSLPQWFEIKKGNKSLSVQAEERKTEATKLGLKENSPEYRAYVLTGKMPREDQQPLTATDKKAIMEADEGVLAAKTAADALREAKTLSKKAYEGPLAGPRGYATSLVGVEGGQATTELSNLVMTNALSQLKSIFGAAPTEGERKILLDIQGSVSQPDSVRQKIYDRAIMMAERRMQFNKQRADELRGHTYYKTPGGAAAPAAPAAPDPLGIR